MPILAALWLAMKMDPIVRSGDHGHEAVLVDVLESTRSATSRSVNAVMAAAYWGISRRIVGQEHGGKEFLATFGNTSTAPLDENIRIWRRQRQTSQSTECSA